MIPLLVVVMVRPAVSENCPDTERDERGKCPPKPPPQPLKKTELDIHGIDIVGARVSLDGREVGLAPLILPVTPGRHHVELNTDDYKAYSKWVDVKPGERVTLKVQPMVEALPAPSQGNCPVGMMYVSVGKFEVNQEAVTLAEYCIDKMEVTVKAYVACVVDKGCSAAPRTATDGTRSPKEDSLFCNRDDRPDHPINCVDWNQATAYCKWAHKRLPTSEEWEYAALGNDRRIYPWGNALPSARSLNACGTECVAMLKRVLGERRSAIYNASDGWETTAPVGSFPGDVSPFGVLDMAGNVSEWTSRHMSDVGLAEFRGGSWRPASSFHPLVDFHSGENHVAGRYDDTGFRCARGD